MNDFRIIKIKGKPVGKARPRVSADGHMYTPQSTVNYERQVALAWKSAHKKFFFEKGIPLEVHINIYMYIPKNTSEKEKKRMLSQKIFPVKKPDIDNIAKAVLDGLNGVAWHDDNQIVFLAVKKLYSENPHVIIGVRKMEGAEDAR